MIREEIHPKSKHYHVKGGDARVFGQDSDVRRKMSDQQLEERFALVWAEKLESEARGATVITADQARELLEEKQREYVLDVGQYRQFVVDSVHFVVHLNHGADQNGICNRLWSLGTHRDPARLCMVFDTVVEKEDFDVLAKSLGYEPRNLALSLVMDFMRKHPKREPSRRM